MKTPTIKNVADIKSFFVSAPMVDDLGSITDARTTKEVARELLMENESIVKEGHIYYFAILKMGLNVYRVKLRPKGMVNTFLVKEFEKHIIEEGGPSGIPTSRY